jgi:hypothetical protein
MSQDILAYSFAGGAAMFLVKWLWTRVMGGPEQNIPAQIKALETAINLRFVGLEERLDAIEETLLIAKTLKPIEDAALTSLKSEHAANMRLGSHCAYAGRGGSCPIPPTVISQALS